MYPYDASRDHFYCLFTSKGHEMIRDYENKTFTAGLFDAKY